MDETLNRSVKRGATWVIVERIALQALNLLTSVILARLLTPTDFGLMGIVTLFTGLATRLVQFGFGMALVQRETIRKEHVSAMFLMTLGINAVIWISLTVASPSVGRYFKDELVGAWKAALKAEGGDPAGKPIQIAEAQLFQDLIGKPMTAAAKKFLQTEILAKIPGLLQGAVPRTDRTRRWPRPAR